MLTAAIVIAPVRLFACMGASMSRQRAALDETLTTAVNRTKERALIGMNSMMPLQIRFATKALHKDLMVINT